MEVPVPTIKTPVSEEVYARLVEMRRDAGVPSVSALFLLRCEVLDDDSAASEIVEKARRKVAKMPPGTEFKLRDLFPSDWGSFPKGARLRAGRRFVAEAQTAKIGVLAIEKTSAGQQRYRRCPD